jgi:hypothetical protein
MSDKAGALAWAETETGCARRSGGASRADCAHRSLVEAHAPGHLPFRRSAPRCLTADLARCACSAIDGGIPRLPNAELRGTHSYLWMMAPIGVLADTCAAARPTRST